MKTLIKTIVLFLVANFSFAQTVQLGVRMGANGSKMTQFELVENLIPEFKFLAAPSGAIYMDIPVGKNFSIQPELAFTQKGFAVKESINVGEEFLGVDLNIGGRLALKTNYIEMPVLAKIKFGNDHNAARGYITFGPAVGYMADAGVVVRVLSILPIRSDVGTGFFNQFEFSGIGGAGVEIPLGKGKMFIEGRYQHGFSRTLDTPVIALPVRNRTFGGSIGFSIPIRSKMNNYSI
jgi:Outer membrane protein beta-barrel domain